MTAQLTVAPIAGAPRPADGQLFGAPRGTSTHKGVDIAGAAGTPVYWPVDVTIERVVTDRAPGQAWYVDTAGALRIGVSGNGAIGRLDDGRRVLLSHMRPVGRVGQRVTAGTLAGYLDRSGTIDGTHLHLELHTAYPGSLTAVDPLPHLNLAGVAGTNAREILDMTEADLRSIVADELDKRVPKPTDNGRRITQSQALTYTLALLRRILSELRMLRADLKRKA